MTLWTAGAERLFGYAADEMLGAPADGLFTPEDRAAGQPAREVEAARAEGVAADERWHVRKDGSRFWASGTLHAVVGADSVLQGFVKVARDNTLQKAQEDALRASEERLRLALDAGHLGAWHWNLDTGAVRWSPTHNVLMGLDPAQTEGSYEGFIARVHPDDRARVAAALDRTRTTGEPYAEEFRAVHPDGSVHWIAGHGEVARGTPGEPHRMTGVIQDVTERHTAEARLQAVNAALEDRVAERTEQVRALTATLLHAEQEERTRIAHVLHDHLQQLLYALQMQVGLFVRASPADTPPARSEAITRILDEAVSATRSLAVDLAPPVLQDSAFGSTFEWLAIRMETAHGLTVAVEVAEPAPNPSGETRMLLFQLVRELLFNVVKHGTTDAATVRVRAGAEPGTVEVEVEDGGAGFDVAEAEARQRTAGGFGLFSVRDRVGLLGGRMEIRSAPGAGTRVTLAVPAV